MRPADQVNIEILGEFLDHILSEGVTDATLVLPPSFDFWVGIRPEQVAE